MGSRFFKSLFFGSSSNNNRNSSLKGKSGAYESTVAQEPPVRGSYPVAGNGPNVEETLHQARLKREAKQNEARSSSLMGNIATRKPSGNPKKVDVAQSQIQRPQTAPSNDGSNGIGFDNGRTRSGFSMKSPPSIFRSRRDSLRSMTSPPPTEPLPPLPPHHRQVQTYQPTKGPNAGPTASSKASQSPPPLEHQAQTTSFVPPFAEKKHSRNFSHNSHVDILDAYSNMRGPDVSKQRAKATGLRTYGEDVADRNIADFGDKDLQRLDLDSPEFAYMKSVYAGKRRQVDYDMSGGTRNVSDDIEHKPGAPQGRMSTAPRSGTTDSTRQTEDEQSSHVTTFTQRYGALSLESPATKGYDANGHRHKKTGSIDFSTLPRGRQVLGHNPPSVAPPGRISSLGPSGVVSPTHESKRSISSQHPARVTSPVHSRPSSSHKASQNPGRPISRPGSVSYSAFPSISTREHTSTDNNLNSQPRSMANSSKRMYLVDGTDQSPKQNGMAQKKNTVDVGVATKQQPAVTHETVQPTIHQHRQERIIRGIHNHDVFLRSQPIIEPEFLPANHYFHCPDRNSLVEIPEDQIPGRTRAGSASKNWRLSQMHLGQGDYNGRAKSPPYRRQSSHGLSFMQPLTIVNDEGDDDEAAEPPVISLVRNENSNGKSRSRGSSRSSSHTPKTSRTRNILEPILASRKDSVSPEGYSRREYLWKHQPQFENYSRPSSSRSNPVYVGAGTGDLSPAGVAALRGTGSRDFYYSDESDNDYGLDGSRSEKHHEGEDVLFRDSGYGGAGGLPGISENPYAISHNFERLRLEEQDFRMSDGRGLKEDIIVEDEQEDDDSNEETAGDGGDERSLYTEDDRPRTSRRHSKRVRVKRSSSDLRRVASKQQRDLRL